MWKFFCNLMLVKLVKRSHVLLTVAVFYISKKDKGQVFTLKKNRLFKLLFLLRLINWAAHSLGYKYKQRLKNSHSYVFSTQMWKCYKIMQIMKMRLYQFVKFRVMMPIWTSELRPFKCFSLKNSKKSKQFSQSSWHIDALAI